MESSEYIDTFGAGMNASGNVTANTQRRISERFNHVPGGSNILYMDGHVEFVKYLGKDPLTGYMSVHTLGGGDGTDFKADTPFTNIMK